MFRENIYLGKPINAKHLCWLLIAVGVYTILPFLFLAQFNQPSADDFTLAVRDTINPLSLVLKDVYLNWSGRYLAPVISRLNPLVYNPPLYKVFPIILILGFITSVIILIKELFKSVCSFTEILALSSLFIYLVFSQTPSISEAFYWFSGACIYQTANIATLLLITLLSKLNKSSRALKNLYTLLATLLCIFIIGCNEISMVVVLVVVYSTTMFEYLTTKAFNFHKILLCVVCTVCGAFVIFAPGNFSRIGDPMFYNKSPLWTVIGAASLTMLNLVKWGTSLIVATFIYLILLNRSVSNVMAQQSVKANIKVLVFSFTVLFVVLQIIIIYTAGGGNLGRIENNVYLFFLFAFFLLLHLFIYKNLHRRLFQFAFSRAFVVLAVLLFLVNVFDLENNVSGAYIDLISGRARKYNAELNERLAIAKNCTKDTCYVPPLSVIPKSLFVTDIRPADDTVFLWINRSYATYYSTSYLLPSGSLPLIEPNFEIIKHLGKEIRKNIVRNK